MTPAPPRSRGGRVLVGALVVDAVGNGLFLPLSLVYFVELTGVRLGVVGVLLSVATAITLPVPLWAGSLADRLGALRVVVGAQVLQAAGFLAYVWVEGPVTILLASTVVAVGVRFFWSAVFTALAGYADGSVGGRSHDSWYALAAVARTAGLAVGGVVTGLVIADGRAAAYRSVAWIAVGCFAAAAVLIAVFVRVPRAVHHHGVVRSGWAVLGRDRPFLALTALNTVWALTSMMLATALPTVVLEAIDGPAWLTSVVLVANFVGITLVSTWVVRRGASPWPRSAPVTSAGWSASWRWARCSSRRPRWSTRRSRAPSPPRRRPSRRAAGTSPPSSPPSRSRRSSPRRSSRRSSRPTGPLPGSPSHCSTS